MLAFWQYNLRQSPLGFPALGFLKLARGLLGEIHFIHYADLIKKIYSIHLVFVCRLKSDSSNSPFTMPIIAHHAHYETK
jgi:hypothetical protein